jgi:Tfp pilus assembly protein PilX
MNGRWKLLKKTHSVAVGGGGFRQLAGEHGFALVFTLLLLSMMSLIALAMVLSSSTDMMINGYYSNARGSFYAADSGLSIARQQLLSQIMALVPPAFGTMPSDAATTALNNVTAMYASSTPLNAGKALNSWGEAFVIPNTAACPTTFILPAGQFTTTSWSSSTGKPTGYQYIYNYNICAVGTANGSEQTTVSESGSFILNISQQESTSVSFSIFGGWVGSYPVCLGALIPGTMTGPMFTNDAWEFMPGGAYIFTDPVGQANPDADFWFGGDCIQSPTSYYTLNNQTIKPTFEGNPPFSLGQPPQTSPTDSFSQEWAVIDGRGCGEGNNACGDPTSPSPPIITPATLNVNLKNAAGTAYPSTGASSGVYFNYTTNGGVNTMAGGGFYVEGDANVALSTSGTWAQVISITQGSGSSATTTTITIDPVATSSNCLGQTGTTTITTQGGSSAPTIVSFCSVPMNQIPTIPQPGTMLYVNGNILSMSGPGQGVPAIQDGAQLTIVAHGNVDITGDVVYKTEPVTTTDNQYVPGSNPPCCNGLPAATLIPGNDKNQVLGIFTANGNINLMSPYSSNNNLQVDGSLAPLQQNSFWCFTCTGYINTFNNVGGQIQSGICGCDMDTENTYFDRRFTARAGFAPPWFPATTVKVSSTTVVTTNATVQRVQWLLNNMSP